MKRGEKRKIKESEIVGTIKEVRYHQEKEELEGLLDFGKGERWILESLTEVVE